MSSSLCGRLRLLFQQKPNATATTATSAAAVTATVTSTRVVTSKGDDRVRHIVKRFKKKSSFSHFRRSSSAYKATARRLIKSGDFSSIHDIIDHQKGFPEITDEKFTTRLIILYGKARMLDHALKLFDEMPDLHCPRTVLSINSLMAACFPSKKFDKAIEFFQELPTKLSIKPDIITYGTAIRAYCEMGSLDAAISLFQEMEKNDLKATAVIFSTLLRACYGHGRFSEAENLWNLMDEKKVTPDLRCYNVRLFGMVREKQSSRATNVFKEIEEKGLKPNKYTYNLMIRGFVNEGNLEEAKKWYKSMIENGLDPDFVALSALIPFACDNNGIDFAYELCKKPVGGKNKISRMVVQKVLDKLVEQSKVDKAKELLELYASKSGLVLDSPPMPAGE